MLIVFVYLSVLDGAASVSVMKTKMLTRLLPLNFLTKYFIGITFLVEFTK